MDPVVPADPVGHLVVGLADPVVRAGLVVPADLEAPVVLAGRLVVGPVAPADLVVRADRVAV